MFLRRSQNVQSRSEGSIAPSLGIELFPPPANILRLMVHNRKHPAEEEKIAGLHRLHISTKRGRGSRKLDTKLLQPAVRASLLRTLLSAPRWPTCAPSSTCSTSPVT